jgi:PAS domain S-box-containing protein
MLLLWPCILSAAWSGVPSAISESSLGITSQAPPEIVSGPDNGLHTQIKIYGFIFFILVIILISVFLRKNKSFKNDLTDTSRSGFINLKTGRLLLFLGAFIIPAAAFSFSAITSNYGLKFYISIALSLILFTSVILTYVSEPVKKNIGYLLMFVYSCVVAYYTYLVFYSSLNPFFIIGQIISISLGTTIFNKTRDYVVFSIIIALISSFIAFIVPAPVFSPILYILAVTSILFVSILTTYIRLSLSDKLIFSDTVINDGGSLVMAANKNGEIIFINKTFTDVLGFTEEEVLGQGWWKVRKVISNDKDPFAQIKKGEIENTATVLLETKSKGQKWIQWNNTKLNNGVFVGIGTDITERREYEQRFRQLVQHAQDMIYTTDSKGNFNYMNDVALQFTGYEKDELLGKNYTFLIHENYRKEVGAFYADQIREKRRESYYEFPFKTKTGQTLWIGQSVLCKFDEQTGEFKETQVICRDVNERVLAEQKLKQHNKDLNVINLVKEIILASQDPPSMYMKILLLLGANSDKTNFISINIFSKVADELHTYGLESDKHTIEKVTHTIKPEYRSGLKDCKKTIIDLVNDKAETEIYRKLQQPVDNYKNAVILPIGNSRKTYGFVGFYSLSSGIYQTDNYIMVRDICTSLASFFVQYEQRVIIEETNKRIENYSKQLEILNESKSRLMSYSDLNELYKGLIDLLYEKTENVYRVSILIHDFEKNLGNLIYKDEESPDTASKYIPIKDVPTIPNHLEGRIYEKANFDVHPDLSNEDQFWHSKGVKSVISLPIIINGTLFASVNLLSKIPNNFTDEQKAIIKEVNESAATVIEQIQYKEIIQQKNKDISDNINYARRIQSALMPTEELLHSILPESFLIFRQRDSLGGDFYWFEKKEDTIFLAVGDCTGHGVSGSLLTILASDFIKQAVEEKKLRDPALILEYLSVSLQGALNKYQSEDDEILDGLDISFGIYNAKTKLFLFSSAIHSFFLARNNELIEYKGNRKPIGGANVFETQGNFTTHVIQLEANDLVYFTTDGFLDQFHHKTEKRYGRIRLKQILLQINDRTVQEQKQFLIEEHEKWKGNQTQTDDICFMAFKA